MTSENRIALVVGANGGIGGEVASALLRHGWQVRGLARNPGAAAGAARNFTWIKGDASDAAAVAEAAAGCALIVHAVNPPGYRDWDKLVLPMLDSTIAAAKKAGARIVLPGTVYNFGPDAFGDPREDAPQNPVSRKGAIRVEMERRLRQASREGAPALIVRFGDFFGPRSGNNWFAQGLVQPGRPVHKVSSPGTPGVGHQWAYLPDAAETIARLADRSAELKPFAVFHFEGHWDADGNRMVETIRRVAGGRGIKRGGFPWWAVTLGSPFVTLFREMREMRYLWQVPLRMRNDRLIEFLGEEPHTDWDEAVKATLRGLGSLPEQDAAHAPHGASAALR